MLTQQNTQPDIGRLCIAVLQKRVNPFQERLIVRPPNPKKNLMTLRPFYPGEPIPSELGPHIKFPREKGRGFLIESGTPRQGDPPVHIRHLNGCILLEKPKEGWQIEVCLGLSGKVSTHCIHKFQAADPEKLWETIVDYAARTAADATCDDSLEPQKFPTLAAYQAAMVKKIQRDWQLRAQDRASLLAMLATVGLTAGIYAENLRQEPEFCSLAP